MKPIPKPVIVYDPPRRAWIRGQPCCVCEPGKQASATECAHVQTRRNAGDHENLVPICVVHHREQHRLGIKSFARVHRVDLEAVAQRYHRDYDREMGWL